MGLTATAGYGEIDLAWTASTDDAHVAGYTIVRDGTPIATSYSATYADTGVAADSPHTYTVAAFDGTGNASDPSSGATATAKPPAPTSVTYAYDIADRLTAITSASGSTTSFTFDALGRHASQTIGTNPTSTYSYLGSGNTIVAIASGSTTTVSAIDAVGDRVATGSGGNFGYLLPDLHGNTAAAFGAAGVISDAFAYDAYGNLVASITSALPTPWRYQGRILESASGTPDLYDFGSRSYSPGLGTFTSLDTSHGSAGNPALLNGYLYANANPATLVDPDGHAATSPDVCALSGGHSGCTPKAGDPEVERKFQNYLNTQRAIDQAAVDLPHLCEETGGHASGCTPVDHHPEVSWSQTMASGQKVRDQEQADAAAQAKREADAQAAAAAPRDCGFMGMGCVVGNVVSAANQARRSSRQPGIGSHGRSPDSRCYRPRCRLHRCERWRLWGDHRWGTDGRRHVGGHLRSGLRGRPAVLRRRIRPERRDGRRTRRPDHGLDERRRIRGHGRR